ncbi:MAG TPA: hypothetical protein VGM93_11515, partial [Acidimicrobiales bacterium]
MTDHDDLTPDARGRLTNALHAAAQARPVDDGWEALHARVDAGVAGDDDAGPTRLELRPTDTASRGPRTRRVVAAAAVFALAVGGIATVARHHESSPTTGTGVNTGAPPTGWLVPDRVPAGWTLYDVETDYRDVEATCPCRNASWVRPAPAASLVINESGYDRAQAAELPTAGTTPVDLGHGATGRWSTLHIGGKNVEQHLQAHQGDRQIFLGLNGDPDGTDLIAIARQWASGATARPPSGNGWQTVRDVDISPDIAAYEAVSVIFRQRSTGRHLGYELTPAGFEQSDYLWAPPNVLRSTAPGRVTELHPTGDGLSDQAPVDGTRELGAFPAV